MRSVLFFLLFVLSAAPLFAGADADLRKGNKAYDKEKYGQAFELYKNLINGDKLHIFGFFKA